MCVPLLTSACPDPHARSLSLLSCLLGFAGVSLPSRALSPPCRTRQRKAASAQSSRSGGEGGSVLVGMESTASTGESGPPPLPDSEGVLGRCLLLAPGQAAPPAFNRMDCQRQVDTMSFQLLLSSPESAGVQALCVESPGAERSLCGGGCPAGSPHSFPVSERLLARGLFLIYLTSLKLMMGSPLKNKKYPKFCFLKPFFSPRSMKDSFS